MAASWRNLIIVLVVFALRVFTATGSWPDAVLHRPFKTTPKLPVPNVSWVLKQ